MTTASSAATAMPSWELDDDDDDAARDGGGAGADDSDTEAEFTEEFDDVRTEYSDGGGRKGLSSLAVGRRSAVAPFAVGITFAADSAVAAASRDCIRACPGNGKGRLPLM